MFRFQLGSLWRLYYPSDYWSSLKALDDVIEPYVDIAISDQSEKPETGNLVEALAHVTKDRKVLRDQLLNTLLAGRDTTAATLSWLFLELSYQPELYAKLREEVLSVLGTDRTPTYTDLKDMKYLQNCLNESMYPSSSKFDDQYFVCTPLSLSMAELPRLTQLYLAAEAFQVLRLPIPSQCH